MQVPVGCAAIQASFQDNHNKLSGLLLVGHGLEPWTISAHISHVTSSNMAAELSDTAYPVCVYPACTLVLILKVSEQVLVAKMGMHAPTC
jgi:hypothetical protein